MKPEQCRAARALLGWTMDDLAREAEVARMTVQKYERATPEVREKFRSRTINAMRDAFLRHGLEFLGNGDGVGVRFKPKKPEDPRGALS